MAGEGSGVTYRCATRADAPELLKMLSELRVPIAGSASPAAHRALAGAIGDQRLIVLLAERGDELLGMSLGMIDPKRFWRDLALRNPQLLLQRVSALIKRKARRKQIRLTPSGDQPSLEGLLDAPSGRHWGESSPQIGHVTLVLLRPEARGSGASVPFMAALLDELTQRGATRADARIARTNIPSIRMCQSLGLNIEPDGGNVFVTGDLPPARSSA